MRQVKPPFCKEHENFNEQNGKTLQSGSGQHLLQGNFSLCTDKEQGGMGGALSLILDSFQDR